PSKPDPLPFHLTFSILRYLFNTDTMPEGPRANNYGGDGALSDFPSPNSPTLTCGPKSPTHDAPLAGWGNGRVFKCLAGNRCDLRRRTNSATELPKPLTGRRKARARV